MNRRLLSSRMWSALVSKKTACSIFRHTPTLKTDTARHSETLASYMLSHTRRWRLHSESHVSLKWNTEATASTLPSTVPKPRGIVNPKLCPVEAAGALYRGVRSITPMAREPKNNACSKLHIPFNCPLSSIPAAPHCNVTLQPNQLGLPVTIPKLRGHWHSCSCFGLEVCAQLHLLSDCLVCSTIHG
jgi:hypothetical protein